jgi:hypothetical protein
VRRSVLIVVALAACHRHHHDARPLREAIVGTWNIICSTQDEHASRCPGNDGRTIYYVFQAGGVFELGGGATSAPLDRGSWTLDGDALDVRIDGGNGGEEIDRYRARIDDDQLVLWDTGRGFGKILARKGAPVETEALAVAIGGATPGELKGVHYTIDLSPGYALTHDGDYQRWSPPGDGFSVELFVQPTVDCSESITGAQKQVDGVERDYAIGIDRCIDRTHHLDCSVEHSRGYLEPSDHDDALALCRSVSIE